MLTLINAGPSDKGNILSVENPTAFCYFLVFVVVVKHSDTRLQGFLRDILDKILLNLQSNGWMTIFGE